MLESIITSRTRINLLLRFFLNSNNKAWLRLLESEFKESSNAIRYELSRMEKAKLLISYHQGNKKIYQANTKHPLYPEIKSLLMKHFGLDRVLERVTTKLGNLEEVYLVGKLAEGQDSRLIDLWIVGENIDKTFLIEIIEKAENKIGRKIRYLILDKKEFEELSNSKSKSELLLLWEA